MRSERFYTFRSHSVQGFTRVKCTLYVKKYEDFHGLERSNQSFQTFRKILGFPRV